MTDDSDNLYVHMSDEIEGVADIGATPPNAVSPAFSLAYLRRSVDPVVLVTTEGRITFLNEPARIFLGIKSVEAAQGRDIWEYWEDAAGEGVQTVVLSGAGGVPQMLPVACPVSDDGVQRHALVASPVVDADGRIESVFLAITDPD